MADDTLEVRMNMYQAYSHNMGHVGQIIKKVSPLERDSYLESTVQDLLRFMVKPGQYTPEQTAVMNTVSELLKKPESLKVRLCDEDDKLIEGENNPGEISLADIVKDKMGGDAYLVNMAVCAKPKVGYHG